VSNQSLVLLRELEALAGQVDALAADVEHLGQDIPGAIATAATLEAARLEGCVDALAKQLAEHLRPPRPKGCVWKDAMRHASAEVNGEA
jgi:hypothetical protein